MKQFTFVLRCTTVLKNKYAKNRISCKNTWRIKLRLSVNWKMTKWWSNGVVLPFRHLNGRFIFWISKSDYTFWASISISLCQANTGITCKCSLPNALGLNDNCSSCNVMILDICRNTAFCGYSDVHLPNSIIIMSRCLQKLTILKVLHVFVI